MKAPTTSCNSRRRGRSSGTFVVSQSAANNILDPTDLYFNASDGTLYVTSTGNNEVIQYNGTTGQFIQVFVTNGRGGLTAPTGLTFDGTQLLVTSSGTNQVLGFNATNGLFTSDFTPGPLISPTDLTFGPDGNLYVASSGTDEVLQYKGTTGKLQSDYVSQSSGRPDQSAGASVRFRWQPDRRQRRHQ